MTHIPRVTLAALKGGAGKTIISMGLAAALKKRGRRVAVFKKGPDYIDSGWLGRAAGRDCYNLDTYLCDPEKARGSFILRSAGADIALIEGNRGLYDGVDADGSFSTAELAKLLDSGVILIVDVTKTTRTAAALVLGCKLLDPELSIRGVIVNRVGSARHERILREAIETATGIPVIGSVRRLFSDEFPQRHLGLLPLYEHPHADEFVDRAGKIIEESVDVNAIEAIAAEADPLPDPPLPTVYEVSESRVKIGVLRDTAFQFYYPENLEMLEREGAETVFLSAIDDETLPRIGALYIGGGFPETHAPALSANRSFMRSLKNAADAGLPIYAECGGLMYLSQALRIDEKSFPMVGVFPIEAVLERKPQGHGYMQVTVTAENPFYEVGAELKGHEFHYSYIRRADEYDDLAFRVDRGHGIHGMRDGICRNRALGTYMHVHALCEPRWAKGIVSAARAFLSSK